MSTFNQSVTIEEFNDIIYQNDIKRFLELLVKLENGKE